MTRHSAPPCRIEKLTLTNFRGFVSQELEFEGPFTLLVGDNGTGKSAILEAIRCLLVQFRVPYVQMVEPGDFGDFLDREEITAMEGRQVELTFHLPAELKAQGTFDKHRAYWSVNASPNLTPLPETEDMQMIASWYAERKRNRDGTNLPLLAYYPAARANASRIDSLDELAGPERWELGYQNALNGRLSEESRIKWVRRITLGVLEERVQDPLVDAVLAGVAGCIDGCAKLEYRLKLEDLAVEDEFGHIRRARTLSEGYWSMLTVLLDMAHRCALLNPHLEGDVLKETPGIVLIDELENHLHPRWQRRVVSDLVRTFPKVQFIASTHSPLIAASVDSKCLYHTELDEEGWCVARHYREQTKGLTPNRMLTSPFFDLKSTVPPEKEQSQQELASQVTTDNPESAVEFLRSLNGGANGGTHS